MASTLDLHDILRGALNTFEQSTGIGTTPEPPKEG
jgi:hypothetical protein